MTTENQLQERAERAEAQVVELYDRVKELEAIVARLPLTADGVPVYPQMWIFIPISVGNTLALKATDFTGDLSVRYLDVYSTREAAEQAAKKGTQQ